MFKDRNTEKANFYLKYIIAAAGVFTLFSYVYWTASPETIAKLAPYLQILTLVIFTVTGLVTVQNFKIQMDDRERAVGIQYANLTQGKTADVDKLFMSSALLNRMYFQMYSHDPHIIRIVKEMGPIKVTPAVLKAEHHAANVVFQKIADVYAIEKMDKSNDDNIEWINTFRSWMKSPILRSHWKYLKYEQHPEVRSFIDNALIRKNKFIRKTDTSKVVIVKALQQFT